MTLPHADEYNIAKHDVAEQNNPRIALYALLLELFRIDELRIFLESGEHGGQASVQLSPGPISPGRFVWEAIAFLERHQLINESFFSRLSLERPGGHSDITRVAQLWRTIHVDENRAVEGGEHDALWARSFSPHQARRELTIADALRSPLQSQLHLVEGLLFFQQGALLIACIGLILFIPVRVPVSIAIVLSASGSGLVFLSWWRLKRARILLAAYEEPVLRMTRRLSQLREHASLPFQEATHIALHLQQTEALLKQTGQYTSHR